MIKKIDASKMGGSNSDWLKTKFHFSFANYHNPNNMRFGNLRVLNDDLIAGNNGFEMHPHNDIEIVTYVVNGKLTHKDSMGHDSTLSRGNIQYISAGTGIYHSEHNLTNETIRTLQIWILTDKKGHKPMYGDYKYKWEDRVGKWLHIVSSKKGESSVKINQDVNMFVTFLNNNEKIEFKVNENRQAYLVQIEGSATINNIEVNNQDALEIVEEDITITPKEDSHYIIIEMEKSILVI